MNASAGRTRPDTGASVRCDGWDNGGCEGTPYCPPRCPRFFDGEGEAYLITPSAPDDRDALVAMYEAFDAYSRTLGLPPRSDERLASWLDGLTDDGWNLLARYGDDVVGHIAAVPAGESELELIVFVHQDYRNRGLGTELVKQLIAYTDETAYDALTLYVDCANQRARAVYEHIGFEVLTELGSELIMRLSFDDPIATQVHRPPAERH